MKYLPRIFFVGLLILFLSHCSDDEMVSPSEVSQDSTIVAFLETVENDSFQLDENGIYFYPIELNPTGTSAAGGVLSIYYTASLLDSTIIDTYDESDGDPIVLRQGVSAVYPVGLDLGMANMNEGDTYGFIIPSTLAYDTLSFGSLIPSNAIVQFEVRVMTVETEADVLEEETTIIDNYIEEAFLDSLELVPLDSIERVGQTNAIIYKRLSLGNGISPQTGELISINYEGRFVGADSLDFDQRYVTQPFEYNFNSNIVIPGLDIGIAQMEFGETALIMMPSFFGYRESAVVIPDFLAETAVENNIVPDYILRVGPYEALAFEVTLRNRN